MTTIIEFGLVVFLLSLLTAYLIALLCSLPKRKQQFWSPVLSDHQLWRLGVYTLSAWLWPLTAAGWGWSLSSWIPYPRPIIVISVLAVAASVVAAVAAASELKKRLSLSGNRRLSEETRRILEPEILSRWTQVGGRPGDVRVEVRAFRTPSGTQGSVTVWVLSGERLNRDVADQLARVVPPHLKFRLEARLR